MRFGGHQTFVIREGWLFKGIRALKNDPTIFGTEHLQDHLGVGKNMAKAIEHWLVATGLARSNKKVKHGPRFEATNLGNTIWRYDPYMVAPTTWWLIHLELTWNKQRAFSWYWFFNQFSAVRFERGTVVETLRRTLQLSTHRTPSIKTLERDVACMLRTYAEVLPRETGDPEDLFESPLTRLGLMTMSRHSGHFRLHRSIKPVPFSVFAYAMMRAFSLSDEDRSIEVSLTDLSLREGAPGRVLSLSAEAIFDLVARFTSEGETRLSISNQAGERILRLKTQPVSDWAEEALSSAPIAALT